MNSPIIVIMGVSGSGKTTVGNTLALKLKLPFFDADDFHPKANIDKMSDGHSLNDEDRKPWLRVLSLEIKSWSQDKGAVLACSALKQSYRDLLSEFYEGIKWIFLSGSFETIQRRIQKRANHFMPISLLKSQFDVLETPTNAIKIDIENNTRTIINKILIKLEMKQKSDFGLIGLGVMGKSIALNVAEKDFSISVYNRLDNGEAHVVTDFLKENLNNNQIEGFTDIAKFVDSISKPRKILLMIKAGTAIDTVTSMLLPYLDKDDVIIDGGNSFYKDTMRRTKELSEKDIHFVGCGISGGEEGARKGPSIMPGCSYKAYSFIGTILEKISAKDQNNKPCCYHIGTNGSGHFVKMIHNGIEYAEMQLLAEIYGILSKVYKNEEIATILEDWNSGKLNSYLLEITIEILKKKDQETYVIDYILDKAQSKGTGSWSSQIALELGIPNTMMASAVFSRYVSSFKDDRVKYSKKVKEKKTTKSIDFDVLRKAYYFAKIINHQQGFALINEASKMYNWDIKLSELARIWTNGCIIRSKFMEDSIEIFKRTTNYFDDESTFQNLIDLEKYCGELLIYGLSSRISLNSFSNAHNYWVAMTTKKTSANLIQAQRDYFGAHTYQRNDIDSDEYFHTNW